MLGRKKKGSKKAEKKISKKKIIDKKTIDYVEYDKYVSRLIERAKHEMGIKITKVEWEVIDK